jgi:photosystem II CP43 chlorophyll apoprotein
VTTANLSTFISDSMTPSWWNGNARLTQFSGLLLGAHLAHAGLIVLWAGTRVLSEVGNFDPSLSFPDQGLLLIPHLAALGFGIGSNGTVDTYPYFVIGILHLVASAVLAAGGLYHVFGGPPVLEESDNHRAVKFHYEWTDHRQLGLILGHHLIFLGVAAWLFVLKATTWGGLYDQTLGTVHRINDPTLNPGTIFGYLLGRNHGVWSAQGLASVGTLQDVVGGHIWIGTLEILGGIWHIRKPPAPWSRWLLKINAHAVLSYSLAGVAWMAFLSCFFLYNPLVFPPELYGTGKAALANVQFLLGLVTLGGHVWHASVARAEVKAKSSRASESMAAIATQPSPAVAVKEMQASPPESAETQEMPQDDEVGWAESDTEKTETGDQ